MVPPPLPEDSRTTETIGMVGGDTLDDIITQNNKEMQRRRSLQRDRRSSAMEFGSSSTSLGGFQFGTASTGDPNLRRQSTGQLEMAVYQNMASGIDIQSPQIAFTSPMQTEVEAMDTRVFSGLPTEISQGMIGYGSVGMDGLVDNPATMSVFPPTTFSNPFSSSMVSMPNDFMIPETTEDSTPPHRGSGPTNDEDDMMPSLPDLRVSDNNLNSSSQSSVNYGSSIPSAKPNMQIVSAQDSSYNIPTTALSTAGQQIETLVTNEPGPLFDNPYSKSGFDMLAALSKVVTRKNPEINIGKVDMSCAFVVCNVLLADCPIVYVSEVFERMTGYTKNEILGRNCRFLQSPVGRVEAGAYREFVDNTAVFYLSNRIAARREAQRSLINYRKGGQPFTNLLTMIPITGEDDKETKYYVGFQVDLVAKPTSVEGKNINGMYSVNYTQVDLPQYQWQPPLNVRSYTDESQLISHDNISSVLSAINSNPASEAEREMRYRVLLENADDVVHVLSLKGLFLYVSPSCRKVLEYEASELVGTALSTICHPSDIVSVTRELKDTSAGDPVSVVFRIRRKKSGYIWFESHGSLSLEPGKARKSIILVGRERPIFAVSRREIEADGGIGENEIWSKLSTSAMFLFVSSNVQTLLDRSPDELVGTSLQALMRRESRLLFGRALDKARAGERITYKHEMLNKKGQAMQAHTKLYPGDAVAGRKPTFLVAQTRLLKSTPRPVAAMTTFQSNPRSAGSVDLLPTDRGLSSSHASSPSQDGRTNQVSNVSISGSPAGTIEPLAATHGSGPVPEDDFFDELKTTHCTSWQFELRQMEKTNRLLSEELASLLSHRKKRKRRKGVSNPQRDCANCHTRVTPEWRRGPSGQRDLCNSCGLRWAKQVNRSGSDSGAHKLAAKGQAQKESSSAKG